MMFGKWNEESTGQLGKTNINMANVIDSVQPKCHTVYSNLQGRKDGKCPFYHAIGIKKNLRRGKIIQLSWNVKFHFFEPGFDNQGHPSTNYMAILSYGEDSHPHVTPAPRKIPALVQDELFKTIREYGLPDATARRVIASPILPIMMNGATTLSKEHIAMTNQDAVNHLIRKLRIKEYPWGTDFLGIQRMMTQQTPDDPYIRATHQFPDGHFVVLCQFIEQSKLFFQSYELQVNKTFSCTKCRELEINAYDHSTRRITTLARVFTDYEDGEGYYQAFSLVFAQAEKDVGEKIPWGHLVSAQDSIVRIKAILVDEHGGQVKGLGR